MPHKIYKVVKLVYHTQRNGVLRQRISVSVRHSDFTTIYPVADWITIPIGLSFVFIDEDAAAAYHRIQKEIYPTAELWICQSQDAPQHIPGMSKHWSTVPVFWEAHAAKDVATLAQICIACPEEYYGVKTLRLFSKLG